MAATTHVIALQKRDGLQGLIKTTQRKAHCNKSKAGDLCTVDGMHLGDDEGGIAIWVETLASRPSAAHCSSPLTNLKFGFRLILLLASLERQ
jgi:hypothetical protein